MTIAFWDLLGMLVLASALFVIVIVPLSGVYIRHKYSV